jgi:repressor LexA
VLSFIASYYQEHGWAPSVRDICKGVGLSSSSVASLHLLSLVRDGLIKRSSTGEARCIAITPDGWDVVQSVGE